MYRDARAPRVDRTAPDRDKHHASAGAHEHHTCPCHFAGCGGASAWQGGGACPPHTTQCNLPGGTNLLQELGRSLPLWGARSTKFTVSLTGCMKYSASFGPVWQTSACLRPHVGCVDPTTRVASATEYSPVLLPGEPRAEPGPDRDAEGHPGEAKSAEGRARPCSVRKVCLPLTPGHLARADDTEGKPTPLLNEARPHDRSRPCALLCESACHVPDPGPFPSIRVRPFGSNDFGPRFPPWATWRRRLARPPWADPAHGRRSIRWSCASR